MKRELPLNEKIQQSLNISWKEGIPAAAMIGILDYYLVPYGLFLGATTQGVGFLVSIPQLLGAVSLLFAMEVVRLWGNRLSFIVQCAAFQAFLLIPIALLSLILFPGKLAILILLVIVFRVLANLIGTAWGSLVSDYLPSEKRGHYFGWRSQVAGMASVAGIGFAGLLLFTMKKVHPAMGFFILFLTAGFLRFLSTFLLSKMVDIPLRSTPQSDFTFTMFLGRFKESNFVRFVLYVSSISFAVNIVSPYLSVYMLRDLHYNYLTYTGLTLSAVISGLISFPIWGKHADVVGNAKILKITSLLIPLIILLWIPSKHPLFLVVVEVFGGFVWGGFNLCATNYIYDAVSPEKRMRCLGYFNLINGCAAFAGISLGGFLADRLPPLLGFSILTLAFISGGLRFLAHFFLSRHFQEVRASAQKVSSSQLFFSVVGIKPLAGLNQELNASPTIEKSKD